MRRGILLLVALGMAVGCARPRADVLEFWTLSLKPTYTAYVQGLSSEYRAAHPGTRLEWLDVPEKVLMHKLLASLAGGESPDLVNLGSTDAMKLAQANALAPVDDLVPPEERARYFPHLWKAVSVGGRSYSIPWYVSVRLLMYNRALFEKAGLDPDRPPSTWDEIEACARRIRGTGAYGFQPTIRLLEDWQMDGLPVVDASRRRAVFGTPAHAERLAWYARMMRDDLVPRETLTGDYPAAVRRYKSGTLAMLISGPQFLLQIRQEAPGVYAATGVASLARGRADIVPAAVMHFVIPRASRNHAGAARLGLFLTSTRSQLELCRMVPLLPSTIEGARDPLFTRGRGEHPLEDAAMRIDARQLPHARDLTMSLPRMGQLNRALQDAVEKALYGRSEPLPALQEAARRWDEILAE